MDLHDRQPAVEIMERLDTDLPVPLCTTSRLKRVVGADVRPSSTRSCVMVRLKPPPPPPPSPLYSPPTPYILLVYIYRKGNGVQPASAAAVAAADALYYFASVSDPAHWPSSPPQFSPVGDVMLVAWVFSTGFRRRC